MRPSESEEHSTSNLPSMAAHHGSPLMIECGGLFRWLEQRRIFGGSISRIHCKIRAAEPERFRLDPIHQMPGLNT